MFTHQADRVVLKLNPRRDLIRASKPGLACIELSATGLLDNPAAVSAGTGAGAELACSAAGRLVLWFAPLWPAGA